MSQIDIKDVDLNLLVAFEAMMQERNVSRAGERVGLSQSSMSHALKRLRRLWGDPLFVRTRRGMEPTSLALQLVAPISAGIAMLRVGLNSGHVFDPGISTHTFHLIISDIGEMGYLPSLMAKLGILAPRINIRVLTLPREGYRTALECGDADLAIGVLPGLQSGFYQQRLVDDTFICLAREKHPRINGSLSIDQFCDESYVLVEPGGSRYSHVAEQSSTTTQIERHISSLGLQRRIALCVPHFIVVPRIVGQTDLLAILPSYVLTSINVPPGLQVLKLPFETPEFSSRQLWHQRTHHDPANRWLRGLIAESCSRAPQR